MKRPLLIALLIGLIGSAVVMGLHAAGLLFGAELAVTNLFSRYGIATRTLGDPWQYPLVFVITGGVAWMTAASIRRVRLGGIVAVLMAELLGLAWVGALYHVSFQPLPSIAGAALGFFGAIGLDAAIEWYQARPPKTVALSERISREELTRITTAEPALDSIAKAYEVTALVCDIANKHDLAEESAPTVFAEITQKFIAHMTETLRADGAYIESAGGEGVVAIFGFPTADKEHAQKATRKAMSLAKSFSDFISSNKLDANAGVHAGVSSGTMVIAPVKTNGQKSMLAIGEPVELARRFCIANRFYGSRVLLGPRTFELASKILVARPIDFLSGVDVRERHEIYEPVTLAIEASRDQITRRDAFWNGVVLYREKRWAESYSQFQKARGPDELEDRPLQLYLRRLEPLALQLTDAPLDA